MAVHIEAHLYDKPVVKRGAAKRCVQELLGHSDVSTTMNVYAHATREAKLLDKVETFPCSLPIRAKTREKDTYFEVRYIAKP